MKPGRLNFPELKRKALELFQMWKPDSLVIEAKATGTSLTQELQAAGVRYIEPMLAHRGNDKISRTNAVSDMFSSGSVWAPLRCKWVQDLQEEMASFPHGELDDLHDAAVWGLTRIRRGGFRIPTDEEEEEYASPAARLLLMATWFNLSLIASEIGDRWYPMMDGPLLLFTADLYTAQGRRLTSRLRAVSLGRALAPIWKLGMFLAPAPRLVLHIADPLAGDAFLPLAGPHEADDGWAAAAIERLKASGKLAP